MIGNNLYKMKDKICILGDGLLGSELETQTGWDVISRKRHNFDITRPEEWHQHLLVQEWGTVIYPKYTILVNCIANTDTYTNDQQSHWDVNVQGVKDLIEFCNKWDIKLVHISTDYIYSNSTPNASETDVPVHCATWYGYTKLVSDALVQLECNNYLLLRSTHKPNPFPYKGAWENQVGNFDYVDTIGKQMVELIQKQANGVFNLGTEFKSMLKLAQQTVPHITPIKELPLLTPPNVSMNINKYKKFINL